MAAVGTGEVELLVAQSSRECQNVHKWHLHEYQQNLCHIMSIDALDMKVSSFSNFDAPKLVNLDSK